MTRAKQHFNRAKRDNRNGLKNRAALWWKMARATLARSMTRTLYGHDVYISATPKSMVAGCVVFWYFEDGVRKFIMMRDHKNDDTARFIGIMDSADGTPLNGTVSKAIKTNLGDVFLKAVDAHLLDVDRVASAPMLHYEDPASGESMPVQTVCWAMQITADQAQLCAPKSKNVEILSVPEFSLLGPDIAPAHKLIYQSVLRHVHNQPAMDDRMMADQFEEMFGQDDNSQKIIH